MTEELHRIGPVEVDCRTCERWTDGVGTADSGVLRYLELLKALAAVRRPAAESASV